MLRAGLRGKCLRLSDDDRRRLAVKAQALGREAQPRLRPLPHPVPSIYSSARPEPDRSPICQDYACMISSFVRARPWARPQTQTPKLLIYGLFQKG